MCNSEQHREKKKARLPLSAFSVTTRKLLDALLSFRTSVLRPEKWHPQCQFSPFFSSFPLSILAYKKMIVGCPFFVFLSSPALVHFAAIFCGPHHVRHFRQHEAHDTSVKTREKKQQQGNAKEKRRKARKRENDNNNNDNNNNNNNNTNSLTERVSRTMETKTHTYTKQKKKSKDKRHVREKKKKREKSRHFRALAVYKSREKGTKLPQ